LNLTWAKPFESVADEEHLKIIRQGVAAWNDWRKKNPELLKPDLREADLRPITLEGANLQGADLWMADLEGAKLRDADLQGAHLWVVDLRRADLRGANLEGADLTGADFDGADLTGANLSGACLEGAQLIQSNLCDATLTGSSVYGVSVWDIKVNDRTKQQNLIIPGRGMPVITVDNIKVAQFIYLLLDNQEIRNVIETITSKVVLILGRFSEERKPVLDALREELRKHDYLPIMFDFQSEANRSTIETVTTLARMAKFIVADLTDTRSVLQELQAIVPDLPSLAVRLMIKRSAHEYGMLDFFRKYPWVIKGAYEYESVEEVIASIQENVIGPAEAKARELRQPCG
jgi:uncharacterized protein YjbI with pentapeptide repeats